MFLIRGIKDLTCIFRATPLVGAVRVGRELRQEAIAISRHEKMVAVRGPQRLSIDFALPLSGLH